MTLPTGIIITDCNDDNARARQQLRFTNLFGVQATFLGVGSDAADVEAAGNLLDQLDAATHLPASCEEKETVMLVNVAPRGEDIKQKWDNGTPFCYFRIGKTLVVSTYAGRCLALARDHGIVSEVELMDIPTVTAAAVEWGDLTAKEADLINHTQFRSLEFLPLVAYWISIGKPVPSKTQSLHEIPPVSGTVWFIDCFGNAKTTMLPAEIGFEEGKAITLENGQIATCYKRLADVPHGATALTIGSSGYFDDRFLELIIQRGSAAEQYNLRVGSAVVAA